MDVGFRLGRRGESSGPLEKYGDRNIAIDGYCFSGGTLFACRGVWSVGGWGVGGVAWEGKD